MRGFFISFFLSIYYLQIDDNSMRLPSEGVTFNQ